ncbi:hypothetical protein [Sphingomonas mollis]|uniref:DUF11 domain-containing protein n=1 Tax=Sphingomonas mollis TaxID=2795726 RepID=A0ABS0XPX9_9SPHN|nr:hypothetical protein [Sphingomonas sp. BT553]MBJ6122099.1 hypothetical protein [Sphingomonas sp. BT553]
MIGRACPIVLALLCMAQSAPASGQTRAGTAIVNTASISYTLDGTDYQAPSNSVTIVVAERLDVGLAPQGSVPVVDETPGTVPLVLTNLGSGQESFTIDVSASVTTIALDGVAIDRNGDGRFDAATDTMLTGPTPVMQPGESLPLLAIVAATPGMTAAGGDLHVTATAITGSGPTTETFPGAGDGGGDAVVGDTGATASADIPFLGPNAAGPTLSKSQAVVAPDGSAQPVSGAVVTYTLVARFPDATRTARIDDPVPAGTTYLPGSLSLDGAVLSDAADGDAGSAGPRTISVVLGDTAPGAMRTVSFKVRLP